MRSTGAGRAWAGDRVSEDGTSGEHGQVEKSSPCWGRQVHRPGADSNLARSTGWPGPWPLGGGL